MSPDVSGPQSDSSTVEPVLRARDADDCRLELPVIGSPVIRERADASRNRRLVLEAAARLFAERGVGAVTMDDIAGAAGVGKGTVFRRFGDKGGLALALLDERERRLQEDILSGPPPLGPGAAPDVRLAAFVRAYLAHVAAHTDLVLMSETSSPGARLRTGAHGFWAQHCRILLQGAGVADPRLPVDLLLAGLAAEQVRHWLSVEGHDEADLAARLVAVTRALAVATPGGGP